RLRFTGTNSCSSQPPLVDTRDVVVDNTPPQAAITSPVQCHFVDGVVSIIGTAMDDNLDGWTLQYTGGATNGWVTLWSDTVPVNNALLFNWNVSALPRCAYTLRLLVSDKAMVRGSRCWQPPCVNCGSSAHVSEYEVSVVVGSCCDINHDF